MNPEIKKIKWWNWLIGVLPILLYVVASIKVVDSVKQSPQSGGWSVILYGALLQPILVCIVVDIICIIKTKKDAIWRRVLMVLLTIIDIIIAILIILMFTGNVDIGLF